MKTIKIMWIAFSSAFTVAGIFGIAMLSAEGKLDELNKLVEK